MYICVCVCITTYTPSLAKSMKRSVRKQFCGFNHVDEMKWVELYRN